eukprot:TRINITY_DN1486_c0_g1_i1.p1 TRINITY_DN1486_c0_g1~~TRINITY_DN1486_c0_g1_i1.p1  ORF type:complete len:111 (+),score=18.81 TRINITY_DN1486_c0_g1_i1:24-356(+)
MKTLLVFFIAFVGFSLVVPKTSAKVEDHQVANQAVNLGRKVDGGIKGQGRKVDGGIKGQSEFTTNSLAGTMAESNPYRDVDSDPDFTTTHVQNYHNLIPGTHQSPEKKAK